MNKQDARNTNSARVTSLRRWLASWEAALILLLAAVIVLNSLLSPYFLDWLNLIDSTFSFSEQALIALPMAYLIIAREIDVSVASIVALSAVMMGLAGEAGFGSWAIICTGLLTGLLAGLLNGVIVTALGVHSIVVTIGTLSLYRGIAVAIVRDKALTTFPRDFFVWGRNYIGGVLPVEFAIFLIATIIFGVTLHRTVFGQRIFAIGANPEAAEYSGVRTKRYRIGLFVLTGLISGLAAILLVSRLGSVRLNIATGWELQVITMVVLGGVSIAGGAGTILGVTLAVFLIGWFTFGLSLINVPGIVVNLFVGLMLIGAIAIPSVARALMRFFARSR